MPFFLQSAGRRVCSICRISISVPCFTHGYGSKPGNPPISRRQNTVAICSYLYAGLGRLSNVKFFMELDTIRTPPPNLAQTVLADAATSPLIGLLGRWLVTHKVALLCTSSPLAVFDIVPKDGITRNCGVGHTDRHS